MVQRLQDILSKLYRPPTDGTRQVYALSRSEAEKLPPLPSIAVISITAPERPPANVGSIAHLLRLSFADVNFFDPDLSERARAKLPQAFTVKHSEAIRAFISDLPDDIRTVIVHCEGGYSRSCAVAVALHRLYGYEVSLEHLAGANPSIIRVMLGDIPKSYKSTQLGRR